MEITLVVAEGKTNKKSITLSLPAIIGRSRQATLTVGHPKISRQHCELAEQDGSVMVRDRGSLNGTFINGQQVKESLVQPGEKLSVGPLTFVVLYQSPQADTEPNVMLRVQDGDAPAEAQGDDEFDSQESPSRGSSESAGTGQGSTEFPGPELSGDSNADEIAPPVPFVDLDDHGGNTPSLDPSISAYLPPSVDGSPPNVADPLLDTDLATPSSPGNRTKDNDPAGGTERSDDAGGEAGGEKRGDSKAADDQAASDDDALKMFLRDLKK